MLRIDGKLLVIKNLTPLKDEDIKQVAKIVLNEASFKALSEAKVKELDSSLQYKNIGRFRVTVFCGLGGTRIVLRVIRPEIPSISDLMLPPVILDLATASRGLVLVTGVAGSGKSTTMAAMIDYLNNNFTKHIVTIEDPIEFEFKDKKSIMSQREVGVDTDSFKSALRSALRQDPDVILLGEMRDHETIAGAIMAAETGHLVISTLHTLGAAGTINRILSFFPPGQQQQIRYQLAGLLKGIVSQRLVPCAEGDGRVVAVEVMTNNPRIAELIADPARTIEIGEVIAESKESFGMQSFDQSLLGLLHDGLITADEALNHCSDKNQFILKLKGITTSQGQWQGFEHEEEDDGEIDLSDYSVKISD
jgi:twitching motility protein PilT